VAKAGKRRRRRGGKAKAAAAAAAAVDIAAKAKGAAGHEVDFPRENDTFVIPIFYLLLAFVLIFCIGCCCAPLARSMCRGIARRARAAVCRALTAAARWASGENAVATSTQTDDMAITFGDADGIIVGGTRSECYHLKADCFYLKNSDRRSLRACSRCAVVRADRLKLQ